MSKPSYDDLVDILRKIWKSSRVEAVVGIEWVNYPVETFEELSDVIMDIESENRIVTRNE